MKIKLTPFFVIAIFLLPLGTNAQKMDKIDIYIFKAKIKNISIVHTENALHAYDYAAFEKRENGSIFITNFDSHWAVEMEIIAAEGQKNIFKKREKITFVVHSPARNIGVLENEVTGEEVNLELHITHQNNNAVTFAIYPNLKKTSSQ